MEYTPFLVFVFPIIPSFHHSKVPESFLFVFFRVSFLEAFYNLLGHFLRRLENLLQTVLE